MKKIKYIVFFTSLMLIVPDCSFGQLMKGFGKKLEKKIENRIERKADRQVDKALDKADNASDKSIDDAISGSKKKKKNNKEKITDNVKEDEAYRKLNLPEVAVRPDQLMTLSSGDCDGFIWFREGGGLEYEITDEKGRMESNTKIQVKDIRREKGKIIAELQGSVKIENEEHDLIMHYVCEGDKVYMDVGAMFKSILAENPDLGQYMDQSVLEKPEVSLDLDNGFAKIPKILFPGLELEDLSYSFSASLAGLSKIKFGLSVVDRIVVDREEVTTKSGTFDCMKIRSVSLSTMEILGKVRNMPPQVEYLWIAPKVGMVKQEVYKDNKAISSMELVKYQM